MIIIIAIYAEILRSLNKGLFLITYLGGGSFGSIVVKYGIHAESTVLKWVKQYNSHEELTDSRKVGGYLMAKDITFRKTTFEERITIVEYCVAHSNDY